MTSGAALCIGLTNMGASWFIRRDPIVNAPGSIRTKYQTEPDRGVGVLITEEDGVPYKEEELSVLQKVRRARNDLVHGRSREAPSEADLKYAVAVAKRMLLYRVTRLNASATEPLLSGDPLRGAPVAVFDRLSDRA